MNINRTELKGKRCLLLGSCAGTDVKMDGYDAVVSVGVRECSTHAVMDVCDGPVKDVEVYCFRGPKGINGIYRMSRDYGSVMSIRQDHLHPDRDLAALNLALLMGCLDITIYGFRDPRDEDEDEKIAGFIANNFPSAVVRTDNNKWLALEECNWDDNIRFEFGDGTDMIDTTKHEKAAFVCCYKSGGDFDDYAVKYVQKLMDGVRRHTSNKLNVECFVITDSPGLFYGSGIKPITMVSTLERWHCKFEIFRTELWQDFSTVVCFDLDTAVVGDISNVVTANIEFGLLSDIYKPDRPASGMIVFRPDPKYRSIFEYVMTNKPSARTWDIYPMLEALNIIGVVPERLQQRFGIYSWKADLHNKNGNMVCLPRDAQIVVWHGRPRPHECGWLIPEKAPVKEVEWLSIPKMKDPKTIYIIGGGPSLVDNNPDDLLGDDDLVIAVNDAYQYKCAKACLFADNSWWRMHRARLEAWDGIIWTTTDIDHKRLQHIEKRKAELSSCPDWIAWNMCTGWAALNMALLTGAPKIVLLGFDMGFSAAGEPNWHRNIRRLRPSSFNCFVNRQGTIAAAAKQKFDAEIVVCEPTALEAFCTMSYADAVAWGRT